MTFMKWILDECPRVRKQSSVHQYFRQLRMLRRKCVGHSLHAKIMEDVNDVLALRYLLYMRVLITFNSISMDT